ncbi:hypothetical protein GCM10027051_34820 [Niabella terrae]
MMAAVGLAPYHGRAQSGTPGIDNQQTLTAKLINLEAASTETFRYNASLHNGAATVRLYQLSAGLPEGWMAAFKVDGSQVTSLNLDPGKTQDIVIEINASADAKPGKFQIPVKAVSQDNSLTLNLEAVVKGTYKLELTTPTGRLSDDVTSGSDRKIQLEVRNTGTIALKDITLSGQAPSKWESSFEPAKIAQLDPGKTTAVTATLTVPDKTIAGDYEAKFTAKNANANSDTTFRITVKTSLLSGWIGILVILLAVALVYYLIRKYGRR